MGMTRRREPLADRLMAKFDTDPETGCWNWTAATDKAGYGYIREQSHNLRAHRAMWITFIGPIPEGLTLDHLCRNKSCVNPDHLEPVTAGENTRRWRDHYRGTVNLCPQGHEFTEENTYWTAAGAHRSCRQCRRDAKKALYDREVRPFTGPRNKDKTHCKRGHELAGDNVYYLTDKRRRCRTCLRERQNDRYDKVIRPTTGPHNGDKTHCKNGHEFTEGNTIHRAEGGRACRQCGRDAQARSYRRKKAKIAEEVDRSDG